MGVDLVAKMGRPLKEIDQKTFENLCGIQCTKEEIAGWFRCSEDTIERWCKRTYGATFAVVFKMHSGQGKISLRRAQFQLAEKHPAMAIWLGKQYLGQTERLEVAHDGLDRIEALMNQLDEESHVK